MSSIQVILGEQNLSLELRAGQTLLAQLREAGYAPVAPCGGRGRCGKCRVMLNGVPRLACKVVPWDGDVVELPEQKGGAILTQGLKTPQVRPGGSGCVGAVDLGTTTVVLRLYDLADGRELAALSQWSAQAPYGADVISRMAYTMEEKGGLEVLSRKIRGQVWDMLRRGMEDCGRPMEQLRRLVVVGNTVMQHLFVGRPVAGMAAAPFRPDTLFPSPEEGTLHGVPLYLAPCVAGYVGGDITAGLLASRLWQREETHLFLDVGTNGEMALGGKDGFLCCAVASGPAFEGAGIACGMPGIDGAVSHVRYSGGFSYEVIGGGRAEGLCGSGLIDLSAELLRLGVISPGGRLLPPEELDGELRPYVERDRDGNGLFRLTERVYLTAADVRSLQLAKAAVAAGIRVLLDRRGIGPEQVDGLYLAGGFGTYMDPQRAMDIGLLPRAMAGRLHSVGNAALAGASILALDENCWAQVRDVAGKCTYLELSGREDFAAAFGEEMIFETGG